MFLTHKKQGRHNPWIYLQKKEASISFVKLLLYEVFNIFTIYSEGLT